MHCHSPRIIVCAAMPAVVVLFATSCSGSRSTPPAPPLKAGRFVYIANANHGGLQGSVSGFAINSPASLAPIAGSPYPAGINPSALATDAQNKMLYAANLNGLSGYLVNSSDGTLQGVAGSPFDTGDSFSSVAISPRSFVYAVSRVTGAVSGFSFDSSGVLTGPVPNSPFETAVPTNTSNVPTAVRVAPSGGFLYTANGSNGIYVFAINSVNGSLSLVKNVKANGNSQPYDIVITPDGRFAFASNAAASGGVDAYAISSGTGDLALINGSPFPTNGNEPLGAATDFSGKLLFVVNFISNSISVFTIGSGGGLTAVGSPVPTDSNPISLAVDPSGGSVYVVNLGAGTMNVFTVGTSGALTLASSTPTGQVRLFDVLVIN
jgi:6-phosphogluconolactonase (cycloisomerase 2 family)